MSAINSRTVASTLNAQTTNVRGRFIVSGPGHHMISDASLTAGGPGEAMSALDLLIASVVVCIINVVSQSREGSSPRHVEVYSRVEREPDDDGLGELTLEIFAEGVDEDLADELVAAYKENCRIYRALRESLDVTFIVRGLLDPPH